MEDLLDDPLRLDCRWLIAAGAGELRRGGIESGRRAAPPPVGGRTAPVPCEGKPDSVG
jgi:hypothetical protein